MEPAQKTCVIEISKDRYSPSTRLITVSLFHLDHFKDMVERGAAQLDTKIEWQEGKEI